MDRVNRLPRPLVVIRVSANPRDLQTSFPVENSPLEEILAYLSDLASASADLEQRVASCVEEARSSDATWEQIGQALGVTRQSAWQRFSGSS